MYYLNVDSSGYLTSVSSTFVPDCPTVESLKDFDFSGVRIRAYRWNGNTLELDRGRLEELEKREKESEKIENEELARFKAMTEVQSFLISNQINTLSINDDTALRWKVLYPEWKVDTKYVVDFKVQYEDRLYKCLQENTSQVGWEPPNVPALWTEINEAHSGDINDPIPYNNNMMLENGKYYTQDGVKYHCTRDSGIPVYNPLKDLVGLYVEVVE